MVPRAAYKIAGFDYGVTKNIVVVATGGMIEKNLDMLTFKGATGVQRLGMRRADTDGLSDFTSSVVYRVYQDEMFRVQVGLGMTFPTGRTQNALRSRRSF